MGHSDIKFFQSANTSGFKLGCVKMFLRKFQANKTFKSLGSFCSGKATEVHSCRTKVHWP